MADDWKTALADSARKWNARPQYGALDPGVLAAIPDDLLEQAVIDFVLNFRAWPENRRVALLVALPPGFGTVYTTWWVDAEVANGGFHQYFWNTEGAYVDLVRDGLRRLEAAAHLEVFDEAVRLAGVQSKPDLAAMTAREELAAFSASAMTGTFEYLDSRWYALGELAAVRIAFMRRHPELFVARLPRLARLRLAVSRRWQRVRHGP
jgi:hypothetical protein